MNKFSICGMALMLAVVFLNSCKKENNDNGGKVVPLRDTEEVYEENIAQIEAYLKSNFISVEGSEDEINIKFEAVKNGETSIWDNKKYPLQSIQVKNDKYDLMQSYNTYKYQKNNDKVDYKLYYLLINEGAGEGVMSIDSVLTQCYGYNLANVKFEDSSIGAWSSFPYTIKNKGKEAPVTISGYRQILSKIKTAKNVSKDESGLLSYEGAGRVVVFVPSGLAYFNNAIGDKIKAYSPVIFDIKLINKRERDHDGDGILSTLEDLNGNGDLFDDDTDGDGIPNFLDSDDDGDSFPTMDELGGKKYKTKEQMNDIPKCNGGSLPKYLDPNCH